jgi:hypothetical protein
MMQQKFRIVSVQRFGDYQWDLDVITWWLLRIQKSVRRMQPRMEGFIWYQPKRGVASNILKYVLVLADF